MPKSRNEWLFLIALLVCLVFPYTAKADDIMDCVHRGQLATKFAQTVAEGYALDAINVRFQRPPRNEQEQSETDAYVEAVRAEVDTGTLAEPEGPQFVNYTEANPLNWRSGFGLLTFKSGRLLTPELCTKFDDEHVEFRGEIVKV